MCSVGAGCIWFQRLLERRNCFLALRRKGDYDLCGKISPAGYRSCHRPVTRAPSPKPLCYSIHRVYLPTAIPPVLPLCGRRPLRHCGAVPDALDRRARSAYHGRECLRGGLFAWFRLQLCAELSDHFSRDPWALSHRATLLCPTRRGLVSEQSPDVALCPLPGLVVLGRAGDHHRYWPDL